MSQPAGTWGPITLGGPRSVVVDGERFQVPEGSTIKVVRTVPWTFVHVRSGRLVFVLAPGRGQIIESPEERRARAAPAAWKLVEGESLTPQ